MEEQIVEHILLILKIIKIVDNYSQNVSITALVVNKTEQNIIIYFIEVLFSVSFAAAFFFIICTRLSALATELCPPDPDFPEASAELDEDFDILLDSPDLPPNNLLLSVLPSTEVLWNGFASVFDFSFSLSFETLVFSDWSDLEDELDFDWSLLLELDFDWSEDFEDDEELDFDWSLLDEDDDFDWSDLLVLDLDCSNLELLDFDWSDFVELDFEPDKLAARLARPLSGLADPDPDISLLEEELYKEKITKIQVKIHYL